MKYDLIIVGAGPAGLTAARTAARGGLKTLLVEKKKDITKIRRYCTRNIKIGPGGFRSDKTFNDVKLNRVNVAFEIDHELVNIRVKNLDEVIPFKGFLGAYYQEVWRSAAGSYYEGEPTRNHIIAFHIDKEALLAGLLEEATAAGCTVRGGTSCSDMRDSAGGVVVTLKSEAGEETVEASRAILADGGSSVLLEKLGFNKERPPGAPELKYLCYVLDKVGLPYPAGTEVHCAIPSIHKGNINIGMWSPGVFQLSCSTSSASGVDLPALLKKVMSDSPIAPWFANSKVIDQQGCGQELRPPVRNAAAGNVICIGDNVAYAETAMKGAFGCGISAARATKNALAGGDGNAEYNDYWQHAFNFFSPAYSAWGRQTNPVARVLNDGEIDALFKWVADNNYHGLITDILPDNKAKLTADLPAIADKVFAKPGAGGRPGGGGRPGAAAPQAKRTVAIPVVKKTKPVIALIADGASRPAGQKTLQDIDDAVRRKFPEYDVRWGFQATYMIEAFKQKGVTTCFDRKVPLIEAGDLMADLASEGYAKVALQLIMVAESSFSRRALDADAFGMTVKYGLPLLSDKDRVMAVAKALSADFANSPDTATVLIGHGVFKDFDFNKPFQDIDAYVRKNYKNVFLGTLHGPPGTDDMVEDVKKSGCKKVRFISLMIATSEHISEDVMGEGPDSWKSRIGLPAEVVDKFAEYPVLMEYYLQSIDGLLKQLG